MSKSISPSVVALLVFIIFSGALVRLWDPARPTLWHDEASTLQHIANGYDRSWLIEDRVVTMGELKAIWQGPTQDTSVASILSHNAKHDPHNMPLINLLTYAWGELFGFQTESLRILPAVIGVLAIPAAFWFGCELSGVECAIFMSAFVAISPFSLHHSHEIRSYSLYLLWTLVACAAFLRAQRTGKISHWIAYGLSYALMIYSHLFAIFLGLGHIFYALAGRKRPQLALAPPSVKKTLLSTGLAYVSFIPWAVVLMSNISHLKGMSGFVLQGSRFDRLVEAWLSAPAILMIYYTTSSGDRFCLIVVATLALLSICCAWFFERQAAFYLTAIYGAYACLYASDVLLGSQFSTYFKYLMPVSVTGLCFVSITLSWLWRSKRMWCRVASVSGVLIILCIEAYACVCEYAEPERIKLYGQNLAHIASVLNRTPEALLVVAESGQYINKNQLAALSHRVRSDMKVMWIPRSNWQTVPSGTVHIFLFNPPQQLLDAARRAKFSVFQTEATSLFELKKIE